MLITFFNILTNDYKINFREKVGKIMKIAVIDGLGGGLGSQIVEELKKSFSDRIEVMALGTNAQATSRMINSGADTGATGENAILINAQNVDVITGPLGIALPNAMMGEITPEMAEAVGGSDARKLLLGIKQPHVEVIGTGEKSISEMINDIVVKIKVELNG